MKSFLLLILSVFLGIVVYPQHFQLSFSASGQSTKIDSLLVKNIEQQTRLTLKREDILLLINDLALGLDAIPRNSEPRIFPNPTHDKSRIEFYNEKSGLVQIQITTIDGKILGELRQNLSEGILLFEIINPGTGLFILQIATSTARWQKPLLAVSTTTDAPQIVFLESKKKSDERHLLKNGIQNIPMYYNEGERLVISAYAGNLKHTKSLIPSSSQNIDFPFFECVDADNNTYGIVTIGDQLWMDRNLETTKYHNEIPLAYPGNNGIDWSNNTSGAYSWYANDVSFKDSYGALYNWFAVNNSHGLCPEGWHVPSSDEWNVLLDYILAQGYSNIQQNIFGAGNSLKSCRKQGSWLGSDCIAEAHPRWDAQTTHHGFDAFGFSALPGGWRYEDQAASFYGIGFYGFWWTTDVQTSVWKIGWHLYNVDGRFNQVYSYHQNQGLSVRCLKD